MTKKPLATVAPSLTYSALQTAADDRATRREYLLQIVIGVDDGAIVIVILTIVIVACKRKVDA
jgi:hypothetical protein